MEELTPELERRVQVEEAWARRIVLSDMLNERRLASYEARRMFLRFHAADFSADSIAAPDTRWEPQSDSAVLTNIVRARLSAGEPDAEPRAPGRTTYWATAIAATAVILLGMATLSGQISWAELAATYSPNTLLEEEGPAPADVLAETGTGLRHAEKAEPLAPVENDDRAQQTLPPQALGVERPDLREEVRLRIQAAQQVADRAKEQTEQQAPSEATDR